MTTPDPSNRLRETGATPEQIERMPEILRKLLNHPTLLASDSHMLPAALKAAADEIERGRAQLAEARRERDEARALVYVPGLRKCAKCGFAQISTNLHVDVGKWSANNEPQDCPNGCGPLWPVTERQSGNELCDRLDKLSDELTASRAENERLRGALGDAYDEFRTNSGLPLNENHWAWRTRDLLEGSAP